MITTYHGEVLIKTLTCCNVYLYLFSQFKYSIYSNWVALLVAELTLILSTSSQSSKVNRTRGAGRRCWVAGAVSPISSYKCTMTSGKISCNIRFHQLNFCPVHSRPAGWGEEQGAAARPENSVLIDWRMLWRGCIVTIVTVLHCCDIPD